MKIIINYIIEVNLLRDGYIRESNVRHFRPKAVYADINATQTMN